MITSLPIPLGAGIHLSEYAGKDQLADVICIPIEVLSSLPSVVIGLSGFLIFIIQFQYGFSIIPGTLTLTVFNLSLLTRTIEGSLQAAHYTQRETRLTLGSSHWETVVEVVAPEATPGILIGVIPSSGRILGGAAALICTAGQNAPASGFVNWSPLSVSDPISIFRQTETLIVHIRKISTEDTMPDGVSASAGTPAVLIIAVLPSNLGARAIDKRLYREVASA